MDVRRLAALILVPVAALVVMFSGTAAAKCCELDHIVIKTGDLSAPLRLDRDLLARRTSDSAVQLLYWPVIHGVGKGDVRPGGELGPRYEITYFVDEVAGEQTIQVYESLYPLAEPPTAFAPRGQSIDLGDGYGPRRVPWGWRPFPKELAALIVTRAESQSEHNNEAQGQLIDGFDPTPSRPWVVPAIKMGAVALGGSLLLLLIRLRARRRVPVGP